MTRRSKQVSFHGHRDYLTHEGEHITKGVFATGGEFVTGNKAGTIIMPGSPGRVAVFDDFLGDLLGDEWASASGDSGAGAGVAVATGTGGIAQATLTGHGTTHAAPVALTQGLMKQWKANQGNLRLSARVKASTHTDVRLFVGFGDSGGAETPIYDTGGGVTANVATGIGWITTPTASGVVWKGVNAAGTAVTSDIAPVDNVYDVLEIDLGPDSGQQALFIHNGNPVGTIANPVNAATAMTPWIGAFATAAAASTTDIDFVNVSANRDTGL